MLADELLRRGHRVTWWTSNVDHFRKQFFEPENDVLELASGYSLRFLRGTLYRRNLSPARLINHAQLGRNFRRQCVSAPPPDVILCSFPTIELSAEAVRFGHVRGIPVLLDIRDLWPDIFVDAAPRALRGVARAVLQPYFSMTHSAIAAADALIAVSQGYLQWALTRAGRAARPDDQVFPLAYSLPERTAEARAAGLAMLRGLGIPDGSIVCLFAGTLGRTYDLTPVLQCARRLAADSRRRFHFIVCGDGDGAAHWRTLAQGVGNVTFTGWLDQPGLRAALAAADIGLAAYAADAPQGVPNKVIEYLAAGLPILSSLRGETEQLLADEQCGLTYDAANLDSFADRLLRLADEDVRQPLAQSARRVFEARFRAETVYARLADLLERQAAQAGRNGAAILPTPAATNGAGPRSSRAHTADFVTGPGTANLAPGFQPPTRLEQP